MITTTEVATSHGITLTSDNAKKFATRLKKTLKENSIDFKTSKCYDILAKTFGNSNWHELSQHLNSNINTEKENIKHNNLAENNHLSSLFDLNWIEFKHIMLKIAEHLDFDFHTKEFLEFLLEILHTNQPKSELVWDKLNVFLDHSGSDIINFRSNLSECPISDYTVVLNPSLIQEQRDGFLKKMYKFLDSNKFCIKFNAEKIEGFFFMLRFLKEENFILRKMHTNFDVSEVLQYKNNQYESDYPFINALIQLADINNEEIRFNANYYKDLTFHDLIVQLYSRTSALHYVNNSNPDLLKIYSFRIAKELFENYKFISYLFSHLKKYVYNKINITHEEKVEHNNIITYHLNYIPHLYILKYEMDRLDTSNLKYLYTNKDTKEPTHDYITAKVIYDFNEKSNLINSKNKNNFLEKIKGKNDYIQHSQENVSIIL